MSKPPEDHHGGFIMCARHGQLLGGVSPLQTWQQELLVKGKGVRREAESEGSRIRLIKDHCSYPAQRRSPFWKEHLAKRRKGLREGQRTASRALER